MSATLSATNRISSQIGLGDVPTIPGDQDRMPSLPQPSVPVIPGTGL